MTKKEHRIDGFIDRGTLKVGDRMKYMDRDGVMRQTSPITHVEVAGGKVYVETQNSIYMNYDPIREQAQNMQDVWKYQEQEYQPPTLERALAERCLDSGKHPKYIDGFTVDDLIMQDQNGQRWYIKPEQIQPGMHIQIDCYVCDMDTGNKSHGILDIPSVQDFAYQNGQLIIESRSSIFSNIDFSNELDELKMERNPGQNMEIK